MTVVLSQTPITAENLARVKHHLPPYLHRFVMEGETISHFVWLADSGPTTLSIVHGRQLGLVYRLGERVCEGSWDDSLCLLVATCCGVCYRWMDDELVALDESQVDQHVLCYHAELPAPLPLTHVPLPTPMASFPKPNRRLGRVSRSDSRGLSAR